ncbi:hypothetical protein [Streptomyces olivaceiscleroticus]|uniref:Fe2OG dioxygenase domain-containing protein n=1 Tax=Streptomyces olivaceiscleroticus TaxID=68245 RepID=A0ABP3L5H0_9ACTN
MIHISETFVLHSVEEFLTDEEISRLDKIMANEPPVSEDTEYEYASRYEPAPAAAQLVLQPAFERSLPRLRSVMPTVAAAAPWAYAEVAAGDCVPVHVDGIPDPHARPRRIGRIGVVITAAEEGGEFYAATTSSTELWTDTELGERDGYQPGMRLTRSLPHEGAPTPAVHAAPSWAQHMPQTRWVTDAPVGTAVAYGAQLLHGVTPVGRGVVRKFVTDLLDAPAS